MSSNQPACLQLRVDQLSSQYVRYTIAGKDTSLMPATSERFRRYDVVQSFATARIKWMTPDFYKRRGHNRISTTTMGSTFVRGVDSSSYQLKYLQRKQLMSRRSAAHTIFLSEVVRTVFFCNLRSLFICCRLHH